MNQELPAFAGFNKIPRLCRDITITEKIDGTCSLICITEDSQFYTGSKHLWITPEKDNHGFSKWAHNNKEELMKLGKGYHFGEFWGKTIQRRYGLDDNRYSLFNTFRWNETNIPSCCHIVPVLYNGPWIPGKVEECVEFLRAFGSVAVPGYDNPEGAVIYHSAAKCYFKKTLKNDEKPKGSQEN